MLTTLLLLTALVLGSSGKRHDYLRLYQETMRQYNKIPLLSQSEEDRRVHYQAFKKHAKDVFSHNEEPDKEWIAVINEFALETDDELKRHLGLNMSDLIPSEVEMSLQQNPPTLMGSGQLPEEVDYSDKMTDIKNQGGCGSCWAFGAVASLEYQVNKNRQGRKKVLSEQQYTDCVYSRDGCQGGWPADCFDWSSRHGGHIASETAYSYTGNYGKCLYESKKNTLLGWTIAPKARYLKGDSSLQAAVANPNIGVVTVAIAVTSDFFSYKEGVYSSKKCSIRKEMINHAVNVVGYGVDAKTGVAYWRVRNSWGLWGDNGYINMKRGVNGKNLNMCQISDWAHYPLVTGEDAEGSEEDQEEEEEEEKEEEDAEEDKKGEANWCKIENKELQGYATGERVSMEDLSQAKAACGAMSECNGLTTELGEYTLRSGTDLVEKAGSTSYLPGECFKLCSWEKVSNKKLKGYRIERNLSLDEAKAACEERKDCGGLSCKSAKKCELVSSSMGKTSRKYDSYILSCY